MSSPFSAGNKELLAQAKANPLTREDQLIPSYWEQTSAAFNSAYYEVGIGISRESNIDLNEQIGNIHKLDLGFGDKNNLKNLYKMRYNGQSEEFISEKMTPEGKERLDKLLAANTETVLPASEVKRLNKQRITGEFQEANTTLAKGDDITAKLIGGLGGAFTSPALLSSMFIPLGQEFAVAKTGSTIAKILKAGAVEGVVGAGAEILNIGNQKRNSVFLGKEFSNWDAARNVALAGGAGFLFGSLVKSGTSAYGYIKDLRQGVNDATKITINSLDPVPGSREAIRVMDDFAYTAEKAIKGDEFAPLHGENITNDEFLAHMDNAKKAFDDASDWGEVAETSAYRENLTPTVNDIPARMSDDVLYKEYLSDADRAFDSELFSKADKIDTDIVVNVSQGKREGEMVVSTRNTKLLAKEIDDELSGLEAVGMCMRGSK